MQKKRVYIKTFGCQMNVYDSDRMLRALTSEYEPTASIQDADLVLYNTCSVREKAEHKTMSTLGRLKALKKQKPNIIIGVGGCVARQEGEKLLEKAKHLDLVFGVDQLEELPRLVQQAQKERLVDTSFKQEYSFYAVNTIADKKSFDKISSYVSIIQGCEKPCTFCIVPTTRGFEKSRKKEEILNEVNSLVDAGTKEVILLGQNVNAYRSHSTSLEELVESIHNVGRLRYITSHPNDVTEDMIKLHKNHGKLCEHIHMPIQAGSNNTLKRMARLYTKEEYLEKVAYIRKEVPDISITSDIIVGFPGETEKDFVETLHAIEVSQFDHVFAFKYSPRPGTPSKEKFCDNVKEEEKDRRLQKIFKLIQEMCFKKNQSFVGRHMSVLVEGPSKNNDQKLTGRTRNNRIVNFEGPMTLKGQEIPVQILSASAVALEGQF